LQTEPIARVYYGGTNLNFQEYSLSGVFSVPSGTNGNRVNFAVYPGNSALTVQTVSFKAVSIALNIYYLILKL
jgi:hypothetical protein